MGKKKKKVKSVKSNRPYNLIEVKKRSNIGVMPVFIQMAHRSLEKGKPDGRVAGNTVKYSIAKDLMKVTITDHSLLEDIESIELTYSAEKTK